MNSKDFKIQQLQETVIELEKALLAKQEEVTKAFKFAYIHAYSATNTSYPNPNDIQLAWMKFQQDLLKDNTHAK